MKGRRCTHAGYARPAWGVAVLAVTLALFELSWASVVEDVSSSVALGNGAGRMMAFADVNNDQKTDLIVVSDAGTALNALIWNADKKSFARLSKVNIDVTDAAGTDALIVNIHAGDFNYDGMADLLVSTTGSTSTADASASSVVSSHVFLGDMATFHQPAYPPVVTVGQPLVLDANGDSFMDLFGVSAGSGLPSFFMGDARGNFSVELEAVGFSIPRSSHSIAFVDFDGDCVADLAMVTEDEEGSLHIEVRLSRIAAESPSVRFATVDARIPIPSGSGQPSYADVDGDGSIDVVVPYIATGESEDVYSSVLVAFNEQMKTCDTNLADKSNCRESTKLCVAASELKFILSMKAAWMGGATFPSSETLRLRDPFADGLPWIRACDYNLDGYADFVAVLDVSGTPTPVLLDNSHDAAQPNARMLRAVILGAVAEGLAMDAAFFDLYEDGIPDLIVATAPSSIGSRSIVPLRNELYTDAYFIKIAVGGGSCPSLCDGPTRYPSPKPYGSVVAGAVVKYTITDVDGKMRMSGGMQLSQSSHRALQTPYTVFGLGRTPNYVKDLCVGVPFTENGKLNNNQWTLVIPNSQLFVFPYPLFEPKLWTLDLLITPAKVLVWAGVILLSMCLILAVVVLGLHWKEKREDEREKRRMAHLFHFDAM